MTLIIQILFLLVVYILFFRNNDPMHEYSEVSIRRALERMHMAWDFDDLKRVFYEEAHRFPHLQQMLYHAYLNQQKVLQGLALEDEWAYNEVRKLIAHKLSQCHNPEMVNIVYNQFEPLLRRHPDLNDMFYGGPRVHKTAVKPKKHLFSMCSNLPEVKKRFRRLAFLNHPDRGGNSAAMQEIIRQYEEAVETHKSR